MPFTQLKGIHIRLSISRWLSLIVLTVAFAVSIYLISPWVVWTWKTKVDFRGAHRLIAHGAVWLSIAVFGYLLSAVVPVRTAHLRFMHKYPPLWLALPTALLVDLLVHAFSDRFKFPPDVVSAMWPGRAEMLGISLFAGVVARGVSDWLRSPQAPPREEPLSMTAQLDWSTVERWARSEVESRVDLLDHRPIATRLASVIRHESVLTRRATALVGPLGSGKSSILRRVEWELKKSKTKTHDAGRTIWTCWISCWGISDSKLLTGHVLRTTVEQIDRHIDASGLKGIPDSYLKMLGALKLGALEAFLNRDQQLAFEEGLKVIPALLELANARVVVFIEDGDRNKAEGFDPAHLEGLVSRLRDVQGITCVLALDRERMSFDISKLCEHVEVMPLMTVDSVRQILWAVRTNCASMDYISPVKPGFDQDILDIAPDELDGLRDEIRRTHDRTVADAIADVSGTPRQLKHVVRRVERCWRHLVGEVDLDHLIAVSVVKECCPKMFKMLVQHIDAVRQKSDEFNKRPDAAKKAWEDLIKEDAESAIAVPIVRVLGLAQTSDRRMPRSRSTQGAFLTEPTDYLRRMLAEELSDSEVRDQTVLRDIDDWVTGANSHLVDRLGLGTEDPRYSSIWRHFAWRIPNEKLAAFADQVFESVLTRLSVGHEPDPTGAWRKVWAHATEGGRWAIVGSERASRFVSAAMPLNLSFGLENLQQWLDATPVANEEQARVIDSTLDTARRICEAGRLAAAVRAPGSSENSLSRLAGLCRAGGADFLGSGILVAAVEDPVLLLPQVAFAFGRSTRIKRDEDGTPVEGYTLDRGLMQSTFGHRLEEMLSLVGANETMDPRLRPFAREAAAWLEELSQTGRHTIAHE